MIRDNQINVLQVIKISYLVIHQVKYKINNSSFIYKLKSKIL